LFFVLSSFAKRRICFCLCCCYALLACHPSRSGGSASAFAIVLSLVILRARSTEGISRKPFWQARYYDFNVFTQAKHVEKLKYMHRNPVTRGQVAKPEDWPWSSFRHYATGKKGMADCLAKRITLI